MTSTHVFIIYFQFDCTNTLNDQVLENVTVQMETSDGFDIVRYVPAAKLAYDQPGICYTLVRLPDDPVQGIPSRLITLYCPLSGPKLLHFS